MRTGKNMSSAGAEIMGSDRQVSRTGGQEMRIGGPNRWVIYVDRRTGDVDR